MDKKESLGQRIRRARTARDLTQAALGTLCGVQTNTVSRWERDAWIPDERNVLKLAAATGVDEKWLRTGKGKPSPKNPSEESNSKFLSLEQRLDQLERISQGAAGVREKLDALAGVIQQNVNHREALKNEIESATIEKFMNRVSTQLQQWPHPVLLFALLTVKLSALNAAGREQIITFLEPIVKTKEFSQATTAVDDLLKSASNQTSD